MTDQDTTTIPETPETPAEMPPPAATEEAPAAAPPEKTMMTVIRPGYLVSLKSTVAGGTTYKRTDLDANGVVAAPGAEVAKWETIKTIQDPEEHERAVKTRSKAVATIRSVCAITSFGLLCPYDKEDELNQAIADARAMTNVFNDEAKNTRIAIYCIKGRVASNDEEAAKAIASEVAGLVTLMNEGIGNLDANGIRDAANRAQKMASMLDATKQETLSEAIKQARSAARAIVKRVEKDSEDGAKVLAEIQRGNIEKARIAFIDMSETKATEEQVELPVVNSARAANIDLSDAPHQPAQDDDESEDRSEVPEPSETLSGDRLAALAEG